VDNNNAGTGSPLVQRWYQISLIISHELTKLIEWTLWALGKESLDTLTAVNDIPEWDIHGPLVERDDEFGEIS